MTDNLRSANGSTRHVLKPGMVQSLFCTQKPSFFGDSLLFNILAVGDQADAVDTPWSVMPILMRSEAGVYHNFPLLFSNVLSSK
jgi:hypothetical protein